MVSGDFLGSFALGSCLEVKDGTRSRFDIKVLVHRLFFVEFTN
jgi:hypothetical protein